MLKLHGIKKVASETKSLKGFYDPSYDGGRTKGDDREEALRCSEVLASSI